jgi:hypothetical protein
VKPDTRAGEHYLSGGHGMERIKIISVIIVMSTILIVTAQPGHCKMKIKIKLPIDVKLQPLPMAGPQESSMKISRPDKNKSLGVFDRPTSIEEVKWEGKEPSPPPAAAAAEMAVVTPQPDISAGGENGKSPILRNNSSDIRQAAISRLNEALYKQHQNNTEIIMEAQEPPKLLPHPPTFKGELPSFKGGFTSFRGGTFNPRDAEVMTVYRGFRMTNKAAYHFRILEEMIARNFPGRQVIITCTTGGTHLDARHYEGNAIDFVVEGITAKESLSVESLAQQAGFGTYNEYIYSSPYKTGDHMHVSI